MSDVDAGACGNEGVSVAPDVVSVAFWPDGIGVVALWPATSRID